MHNRLKQFLSAENITQAQFADTIGIGKANVSHVLSGRNKPGYDFITSIMKGYPQLNINWLMLDIGKMYVSPDMQNTAEKEKEKDTSLLFSSDDFTYEQVDQEVPDQEMMEHHEEKKESETLSKVTQHIVKQRNVSRIIILFDDGSFQEM